MYVGTAREDEGVREGEAAGGGVDGCVAFEGGTATPFGLTITERSSQSDGVWSSARGFGAGLKAPLTGGGGFLSLAAFVGVLSLRDAVDASGRISLRSPEGRRGVECVLEIALLPFGLKKDMFALCVDMRNGMDHEGYDGLPIEGFM